MKNRVGTTKLKRQQRKMMLFSPHNPFPGKQTLGFQTPHQLPPHGRPRCWPCGLPVGRKWWVEQQHLCSGYTPTSAFQWHLQEMTTAREAHYWIIKSDHTSSPKSSCNLERDYQHYFSWSSPLVFISVPPINLECLILNLSDCKHQMTTSAL